jgi:4-hydroxy-tetrahydrodipicolinate synthase
VAELFSWSGQLRWGCVIAPGQGDPWALGRRRTCAAKSATEARRARDHGGGIKNEIGLPYAGGLGDVFEKFAGQVLVTDPLEHNAPIWIRNYGMRFMGTSNYEALGDLVPRMLQKLSGEGTWDEGTELFWQISLVRRPTRRSAARRSR